MPVNPREGIMTMPEGFRLANEDIRLANEGLRVAVLLKHAAESSTLA